MTPIVPVILSGGSGTRLWPLSREAYPKQFLPLVGDDTMLQATWKRVASIAGAAPIVVANQEHRFMAAEQLRECKVLPQALILEPVGRNTAPAIAIAALQALAGGNDALLLVLPSDHVVRNEAAFHAAVKQAAVAAEAGKLVTFGIVPTAAETGYGYIKAAIGEGVRAVDRFVEKPDQATAEKYVASGEYYWNSGMFLFKASRYLKELETLQPAILAACRAALDKAARDNDFIRLDAEAFAASPNDSIDYAVMEKTADAAVVPLDAGWNDVGSWSALWEVSDKDADGNACHGDVIALDCKDSYAYGNRLIAMVGLQDVVVVETDDAVFVGHKDRVQDVKEIVGQIKRDGRSEAAAHRKVYRPWGAYDSIDNGARFQVKRITVKPGATLSLQMHHHRAEHWIVVSGTAEVTRGDEVILLSENQSTYIPLGVTHRLKNPGKLPLELIEVQSGSYLGEDDIVRFEDSYGRA
ncbi:mannose-1-phosphate guanylyltransferase/mannose-6-phosphate isomerase [Stenotrophomonas indicatrix]|jgi:mannose-1-phosphate guanylyltransferase/mannose-6-phosphate isomerase|uniref:mannose-1-phosphate guanylyltransferase/mannose-6-phosphate isomerase n=1 Tax=Stenotrophomonas TaxID=40323 RepID=UPI0003EA75C9|nr:mannose-1-phosphate guanylyltransferase/mannose-6-phosphate isomerase [Stenotrophomonas indicatrix]EVT71099.1 mannose-1-phosphate guanyltransferase [Stenotrophomonas maltophilia 5BA-I-2]MBA0100192.1 mannose-1-phosphate guanylyltransferase/mannose-6-phosphate isomerase [Stenotrophomonas indicatrix]PII14475.1 mannose-1-phosphate guanylyltransferase/mannose-6-phosphate isomerase [Stenotrophomonas indicatrix]WGV55788.1 mannose-1-phosphate guanylyltransferase/mannose-6-phosphate isomerase [Stenot